MLIDNKQEIVDVIAYIHHIIQNCERAQVKFSDGTSQHSLLKNRIHALRVAVYFMSQAIDVSSHIQMSVITKSELEQALPPLASIIHKCEQAQAKYQEDTRQYKRYIHMIQSMKLAIGYVEEAYQRIELTNS